MHGLPSEALDSLVRTLARICDDPYDPVFSAPVPPVPGRRVADLDDFGRGMSEYWIYEDMTVHTATVHRADCPYCNHGAGMGHGRDESASRWLPCSSQEVISSAPIKANSILRKCGARPCRDDPALAWLR